MVLYTLQSTQWYSRAAHRQLAHRRAVPMGQFVTAVQVVLVGNEDGVGEWCRLHRARVATHSPKWARHAPLAPRAVLTGTNWVPHG